MSDKNTVMKKTVARLMVVQALYSKDISGENIGDANDFMEACKSGMEELDLGKIKPDRKFFDTAMTGISAEIEKIDGLIENNLGEGYTKERLSVLLKSVLQAGIWELLQKKAPVKVVMNEYVNITKSFFNEDKPKEAGFVNAVLDKVAGSL